METPTKSFSDLVVVAHDNGKESEPARVLKRRAIAYNDTLFLAVHDMR